MGNKIKIFFLCQLFIFSIHTFLQPRNSAQLQLPPPSPFINNRVPIQARNILSASQPRLPTSSPAVSRNRLERRANSSVIASS